jgi:hypothetical protein
VDVRYDNYRFFLVGVCERADAAADFASEVDAGLRSTFAAFVATLGLVSFEFVAILISLDVGIPETLSAAFNKRYRRTDSESLNKN